MMHLTVIIPMYNREPFIEPAIMSLLRQSDVCRLDILVVNDGSTDAGPQRVRRLAARYPQLRMVTTANQGVTRARNVGLQHVPDDADLVSFLDADDISPINRFRDDLQAFENDPSLQFTYGRMKLVDQLDDERLEPARHAIEATVRGISMSAGIFRASFLRDLGVFDETLPQAEDTDYLFRAFESQAPHQMTETICVYYRRHDGNMTLDKQTALKSFMRAIHKSLARRKADPSRRIPSDIFDLQELMNVQIQ